MSNRDNRGVGYNNPSKEDTRGVGVPYPARTGGRRLAEEMLEAGVVKKGDLVNDGVTFSSNIEDDKLEKYVNRVNQYIKDSVDKEPGKKLSLSNSKSFLNDKEAGKINTAIQQVFEEMKNDDDLMDEIDKIVEDQTLGDIVKEVSGIIKHVNGEEIMNDGQTVGTVGQAKKVNMGQNANAGLANDDSTTSTRLLDKNWSPLIVRKYQHKGWPLFISLICDANLNDLDATVLALAKEAEELGFTGNTIQGGRNFCGYLSDGLVKHYNDIKEGCNEGVAVLWYIDKCFISSLYGDFMVHAPCKAELFAIINTLPHI